MKRDFVRYADILALYCGKPQGYYNKMACNSEPGYGELKIAYSKLLDAKKETRPSRIENNLHSNYKKHTTKRNVPNRQEKANSKLFNNCFLLKQYSILLSVYMSK